jgi:copper chaperone CopZ
VSNEEIIMQRQVLEVTGMTCGGCAANVKRALGALPGVSGVAVSLTDGRVDVRYDESLTDPKAMRTAVRDAGFGLAAESVHTKPRGGCCCS